MRWPHVAASNGSLGESHVEEACLEKLNEGIQGVHENETLPGW